MTVRHATTALLVALLVVSSAAPALGSDAGARGETYAGTHVSFTTSGDAVTDYRVDGERLLVGVETESNAHYEQRTGASLGLELGAVSDLDGSAVEFESRTETRATVTTESGATLAAHDTPTGVLVVRSGERSQLVQATLGADADAEVVDDSRVVVTNANGSRGAFVVTGNGSVAVDEEGDVVADLGPSARLVFRSYVNETRDADARVQERLVANGTAVAEVYVSGEAVDVVRYDGDTSVSVESDGDETLTVTVNRSVHDGAVIVTRVSEEALAAPENLSVRVDGEAAARASSYSDLAAATRGGDTSRYLLRHSSRTEGAATVLVGVNHFSTRRLSIDAGDAAESTATATADSTADGDDSSGTADDASSSPTTTPDDASGSATATTGVDAPGFTAGVGVTGVLLAALAAARRH